MEFDFVRDYELFYQEPGATELLLMIDEGDLPAHVDVLGSQMPANKRAKGAYIQHVARRMRLKRRRVAVRIIVCASFHFSEADEALASNSGTKSSSMVISGTLSRCHIGSLHEKNGKKLERTIGLSSMTPFWLCRRPKKTLMRKTTRTLCR